MILMKAVLSTGLGGEGQTNHMGAVGDVPRGPPEAHGGGGGALAGTITGSNRCS